MSVYETPEFRALAAERIDLITKGYAGEATDADRERLRVIDAEMDRMEAPTIQADIARLDAMIRRRQ